MSQFHIPVLLHSACTYLQVKPGGIYVDATFGGGGHSREIIRLGGKVLGLDQDPEAIKNCSGQNDLILARTNFIHLREQVASRGWSQIDGVLFDLGVSWHQISSPQRGFSFQLAGHLDMRMDPDLANTAATLVNNLDRRKLSALFSRFGEIKSAESAAAKIIAHRPIEETSQLASLFPQPDQQRRIFQALRIAVNDELGALTSVLPQALEVLKSGGRIVVISFHSLEDKIVKSQFREWEKTGQGTVITSRPVIPLPDEINQNPHSASAKLRCFQKK